MVKQRIIFLSLAILLAFPVLTSAQASKAAEKSWNSFWKSFSSAVNRKNKAALKTLMASERDFSSGGMETRDEWLNLIEQRNAWNLLQKSVRLGTKSYDYNGKPSRVTQDDHLIFVYIGKRWRFVGPMGD